MVSKLDDVLIFHHTALNLRAYRQQLLAGNIANADTPNFKARDIDFYGALQGALAVRSGNPVLARMSPRHPGSGNENPGRAQVLFRTPLQPSIDGNTVDMNVERAQFADNAIRYDANLTFISSQIKTLLAAIQG